jgi:formylglycine-generating enzyme required for sulfatase activity
VSQNTGAGVSLAAVALLIGSCGSSDASDPSRAPVIGNEPGPDDGATAAGNATDAGAPAPSRPSCNGGKGAGHDCGGVAGDETRSGADDCCQTLPVPGGSFRQFDDPAYPATVSSFLLDKFEVTVGRFRAWVDATSGDLRGHAPAPGAGAHPKIGNSGWHEAWNALLPASRAEIDRMLGAEECQIGADVDDYGALTWWTPALGAKLEATNAGKQAVLDANTKDALDGKALNCIPWEVLFAFCIWDGGRIPTNAEWGMATAGGGEQRRFAWGDLDDAEVARVGNKSNLSVAPRFSAGRGYVVAFLWDEDAGPNGFPAGYGYTWGSRFATPHDNASHMAPVGRRVAGNGKWGHADLDGGVYEWMLDEGPIRPGPCTDCANVSWPAPTGRDPQIPLPFPLPDFEDRWFVGGARAIRGGAWDNALGLSSPQTADEIATYTSYPVRRTYRSLGGRCARDLAAAAMP